MFHMGWFVGRGYSVHAWNQPWSGTIGADYMRPDLYIDLVRAMERACFDYVMIEDGSFVPDAYGGTPEWYLHNAYTVPKHDPMPLVPLLTQGSSHLGIVATMTTGFYPPYLAARLGATLDHLTQGRVGLNLVTAHNDRTAQNFGLAAPPRARPALRDRRRMDPGRRSALAVVGARRRGRRSGKRHVRRFPQGPSHRLRRQILQLARPPQHAARPAAPAGDLPGRHVARGPRVRLEICRYHRRRVPRRRSRRSAIATTCGSAWRGTAAIPTIAR